MSAQDGPGEIRPAGRTVELFNEKVFKTLRAHANVPDTFVNSGWDFDKFEKGGGKGGSLMARIGTSYIVKEMSQGDHKALLEIAGDYGQHVTAGDTLLCPIYLHFRDTESGRHFFAMQNSTGSGPFKALYDLKGCADDKTVEKDGIPVKAVHKRIWNVPLWCGVGWTPERAHYFAGKVNAREVNIGMTPAQRERFVECLRRDTAWLASKELMDYSLLVAVVEGEAAVEKARACAGTSQGPLACRPLFLRGSDGHAVAIQLCIIDFLQKWTTGKKIARCIKVLEFNKATIPPAPYAARFCRHFEQSAVIAKGAQALEAPLKAEAVEASQVDVNLGASEESVFAF